MANANTLLQRILHRKAEIVARTNPKRIYVENIRAFFGITTKMASVLCEAAAWAGVFRKHVAVQCPNDDCRRVVASFPSEDVIPEEIECWHCEIRGEPSTFSRAQITTMTYYSIPEDG